MQERVAELAGEPGHYATDQFRNPYIVGHLRETLGREIWEETGRRVTAFCQGVGTASSLMGVAQELRPRGAFIQLHEPAGSPAISRGEKGPFVIQGWMGDVPPHLDRDLVDAIEPIADAEALQMTVRLA